MAVAVCIIVVVVCHMVEANVFASVRCSRVDLLVVLFVHDILQ